MDNKVKLIVLGVTYSQTQTGGYILVLGEKQGKRRLLVVLHPLEAQSVVVQLERIIPQPPLVHDLFFNTNRIFGVELLEVNITKFENGAFTSEMLFFDGEKQVNMEARTPDAVALSLRFRCPIFTTSEIMEQAGIIIDEEDEENIYTSVKEHEIPGHGGKPNYDDYTDEELDSLLEEAVAREDYERAAAIRDELKKRKQH